MFTYTPQANKSLSTQINGGNLSPYASQALQMLSLHLPSFLGGQPIAPDALLRPQPGGNSLTSALQGQLGAAPPTPAAAPPVSMGQAPPGLGAPAGGSPLGMLAGGALNPPVSPFNQPDVNAPQTSPMPSQGDVNAPSTPNVIFNGGDTNRQDVRAPGPGVGAVLGPAPRPGFGAGPTSSTMPMPTAAGPGDATPNLAGLASLLSGLLGNTAPQTQGGAGAAYSPRFAPGGQFGG